MKRDWDLIRKQLTDIEEDRDLFANLFVEPKWEEQSSEEFEHQYKVYQAMDSKYFGHLELLVNSGYVEGLKVSRNMSGEFAYGVFSPRLSMAGHDLLDTMRSATIWETIKSTAKDKGIELSFDTIKALGALALKQLL